MNTRRSSSRIKQRQDQEEGNSTDLHDEEDRKALAAILTGEGETGHHDDESDDDGARINAPASSIKFEPLQPLPGKQARRTTRSSAPRPIPNATSNAQQQSDSRTSSIAGSPESGLFINSNIDPTTSTSTAQYAAAASGADFSVQQLSHTPPTNVATSYEADHFGKRARAGSLSERLLASSELEEKGIISRDQKGILKDLIISGQDNELQHALDRYEQGDSSILEGMLQTGTLSNKAAEEIDLLGGLDFDFLNVKESQQQQQQQQQQSLSRSRGNSLASKGFHSVGSSAAEASDGIGDLDFDGGIGGWEQQQQQQGSRSRSNSTWSQLEHALQLQRSRANSTVSIDLDNIRNRSNSLFSSLIGNEPQDPQANYGRWMDPAPGVELTPEQQRQLLLERQQHHQQHFQQLLLQQQQQRRLEEEEEEYEEEEEEEFSEDEDETPSPKKRPGRRASAPESTKAAKERLKEQKKRERLFKKEQKEREKQEKKEMRERAKLEKQKKKEGMDYQEKEKEREVHVPGSGRPRSMSDPNLKVSLDDDGLMEVERPDGWIGAYSPESRKVRIAKFMEKRNHRVWTKTVKYDVRKNFADSRLRVKGRFVKKEDELLMRELMSLT